MPLILCVDDEPDQLVFYRFALFRAGFKVSLASNGQEAVEMARATRPDLILMDMMMPVKNGCQAAREIKADPSLAHIPIILLTAYQRHPLTEQAAEAGVSLVVSKTTNPFELLVQIQDLLPT